MFKASTDGIPNGLLCNRSNGLDCCCDVSKMMASEKTNKYNGEEIECRSFAAN